MGRPMSILPDSCPRCGFIHGSLSLGYYTNSKEYVFVIDHTIPKQLRYSDRKRRQCIFRVKKQKIHQFFRNLDTTTDRIAAEKKDPIMIKLKITTALSEDIRINGWGAKSPLSKRKQDKNWWDLREILLKDVNVNSLPKSMVEFYRLLDKPKNIHRDI